MIQSLTTRTECAGELSACFRGCGFSVRQLARDRWVVTPVATGDLQSLPRRAVVRGQETRAQLVRGQETRAQLGETRAQPGTRPQLAPTATADLEILLRCVDDWWLMEALPGVRIGHELASGDLFRLLHWNRQAERAAKFVVPLDGEALSLRAEIPCGDEPDPPPSLAGTCRDLAVAWARVAAADWPECEDLGHDRGADGEPDHAARELAELCAAAGWPCTERERCVVAALEVSDGFYQAVIEHGPAGGITARVALLPADSLSGDCRRAVAVWLLAASGLVRGIRAVVWRQMGSPVVGFEAVLGPSPSPTQLAELLGSLSVACTWCGKEAAALTDERTARMYLQLRGWSS